jgi:bifunctional non-homologous end joining protein LigD
MANPLSEYTRKRNFKVTAEPEGGSAHGRTSPETLQFVIQKHDARRLHYDFRLELDGTLKSWAAPKGPSYDPKEKRLAVHVEDHPIEYGTFEGSIPEGEYGGGDVIVWDRGVWIPHGDAAKDYAAGKLKFELQGEKLNGSWTLVRTRLHGNGNKEQWLLIKEKDDTARPHDIYDVTEALPDSVLSEKTLPRLGKARVKPDKPVNVAKTKQTRTPKLKTAKPSPKPSALPDMIEAELATLVDSPPAGDWLYEIKFDGYRLLTRIDEGKVSFITRNGKDWTHRLPEQAKAISALGLENSWLDGEIIVLDEKGVSDFQALQNAFDSGRNTTILYYMFDMPFCNGMDLRAYPLEERRRALKAVLDKIDSEVIRYSEAFDVPADRILESACSIGLEGVIGKRAGSPYQSKRSNDWIKLKCKRRQEFVIGGYTSPQGTRSHFGALLIGLHDEKGSLRFAGKIGTGFSRESLAALHEQMQPYVTEKPAFTNPPRGAQARGVTWLKPELLCEVAFASITNDGVVRQGVFYGLRQDKAAHDIELEHAQTVPDKASAIVPKKASPQKAKDGIEIAGVRISHPERVIDPHSKTTKRGIAEYYERVAPWILPHLKNRPVALVRTPEGIKGEQIFQKHKQTLAIPHIRELDASLDPGHAPLMVIDNLEALLGAAQMGTVELHTWNAKADHIDKPDRMIFDLDPDPKLPWKSMLEATELLLTLLNELGFKAFIKTSGGKGLHIVVPLERRHDWDNVKDVAQAIARHMASVIPERFSAKMGAQNRVGKVFIDYLRNREGATTVSAYSLRARPGLGVSVPIDRSELKTLKQGDQWTVETLFEWLDDRQDDPWAGYNTVRQRITAAQRKKLGME